MYLQDARLFVAVADGAEGGPIQPTVVDMGAAGLIGGRWHALVITHRRSSSLLFNKDQLEASSLVVLSRFGVRAFSFVARRVSAFPFPLQRAGRSLVYTSSFFFFFLPQICEIFARSRSLAPKLAA